jgi:hypothetical protein
MIPENIALLVWDGKTTMYEYKLGEPMATTLLGAVTYARKKHRLKLYDAAGKKWRCINVSLSTGPLKWIHRLSTFCFYNPVRTCVFEWNNPEPYDFSEIMVIVKKEIQDDDDILTQWHDKNEWMNQTANARNLKELISIYKRLMEPIL